MPPVAPVYPQRALLRAYGVSLACLLAGGSVVHAIFQPDLHIPLEEVAAQRAQASATTTKPA